MIRHMDGKACRNRDIIDDMKHDLEVYESIFEELLKGDHRHMPIGETYETIQGRIRQLRLYLDRCKKYQETKC